MSSHFSFISPLHNFCCIICIHCITDSCFFGEWPDQPFTDQFHCLFSHKIPEYPECLKYHTIFYHYFNLFIMGKFGHWSCVFFITFDWYTVIMHWTQCWCRWESYESSVSWFSSLKNAERPKLFQKSQFCFFHWLVWLFIISVKHIRQSCFISEAYSGITKFSFFQNHQTCIFLQVWASNLHCNRLQFWATISRLSVHDITFVAWFAFIVLQTAVFWRTAQSDYSKVFCIQNF